MTYRKKLIEVALPLDAINAESAREKSIRHGHPSTLHMWWARRPLATCRAVVFASLVDDPSAHPDQFPTEVAQEVERRRLFTIIEQLIKWENSNKPDVLDAARREIRRSTGDILPPFLDPFCGSGSIPLEAQRLGLEAHGSDLNPVPVLITKALIDIPAKFQGHVPVNPQTRKTLGAASGWTGTRGLADDVSYYGRWMRDEAQKRIGHLYPKVTLSKEYGVGKANVISWLWARTVVCPNPACRTWMPLVRSFWLCKQSKKAWVEPVVDRVAKTVQFEVKTGAGTPVEATKQRGKSYCLVCHTTLTDAMLREQAKKHGIGSQMMAIVAEGKRGRAYISPPFTEQDRSVAPETPWLEQPLPNNARWFSPPSYGLKSYRDLFTSRQLVTLTTFSDLVSEAREQVRSDAIIAGLADDGVPLSVGGTGATAYADAVATYLAFVVDKQADLGNSFNRWEPVAQCPRQLFARQAIPMVWDFAEGNPLGASSGSWTVLLDNLMRSFQSPLFAYDRLLPGSAKQLDASSSFDDVKHPVISTDPPYYDNIGYADLSDFFYVWLRHSLGKIYPNLFSTMLTPKHQELVATPYRFGGDKSKAEEHFEKGLGQAFAQMRNAAHPDYPLTVYYAFKQAESEDDDGATLTSTASVVASTGWETMLEGLLQADFSITGTWPMRTEMGSRMVGHGTNALASSIVLVCRPRPTNASITTRRDFLNALKRELPDALKRLQHGNVAPVDLAQATIGPGMAVFSRYSKVIEANGVAMGVRTALQLINQALDEVLTEQEGEFDADTRWAITWFEQFGAGEGLYGVAETLSKAKNTSIAGLVDAGLLAAKGGKVRLLRRDELPTDWDPSTDKRLTVWETAQHLIRALERDGENGAASILAKLGERGQVARDLSYRLYTLCERKGWADEALAYNSLVIAWQGIGQLASQQAAATSAPRQQEMFT